FENSPYALKIVGKEMRVLKQSLTQYLSEIDASRAWSGTLKGRDRGIAAAIETSLKGASDEERELFHVLGVMFEPSVTLDLIRYYT
ncbi:hypothetical protein, partial [Salmonella sp. SAL4457]|uniref:hypothetical protein n=1 Tax=Salmonella sp. SAL4457 TaxID=3159912 RepID=UPI00397E5823